MGKSGCSGRRRKLTIDQEKDLLRRHKLYTDNCPKKLAADFGLSINSLSIYVSRAIREANGIWP